jgi:hypothetical protein
LKYGLLKSALNVVFVGSQMFHLRRVGASPKGLGIKNKGFIRVDQ